MTELPSGVFQFIHSVVISIFFLRVVMEGEERGQREDGQPLYYH